MDFRAVTVESGGPVDRSSSHGRSIAEQNAQKLSNSLKDGDAQELDGSSWNSRGKVP